MSDAYKIYLNKEKTVAVEVWEASGYMCVKTRDHPGEIWGLPITVEEEKEG